MTATRARSLRKWQVRCKLPWIETILAYIRQNHFWSSKTRKLSSDQQVVTGLTEAWSNLYVYPSKLNQACDWEPQATGRANLLPAYQSREGEGEWRGNFKICFSEYCSFSKQNFQQLAAARGSAAISSVYEYAAAKAHFFTATAQMMEGAADGGEAAVSKVSPPSIIFRTNIGKGHWKLFLHN